MANLTNLFPDGFVDSMEIVLGEVATKIVLQCPNTLSYDQVNSGFSKLLQFIRKSADEIGAHPYAIELAPDDDSSAPPLDAKVVASHMGRSSGIIRVGAQMGYLGLTPCSLDLESLGDKGDDKCIVFVESFQSVYVLANGRIVRHLNASDIAVSPPKTSRFARHAADFEYSVVDHYHRRVRYNQTDHWQDKKKRLLRARKGRLSKTEHIFHEALFMWLDDNIYGGVVNTSVPTRTGDETDIEIRTPYEFFVIEIKWLGTNENGTPYGSEQSDVGIRQIREYLVREPTITRISLVIYDGREYKEFISLGKGSDDNEGCRRLKGCLSEQLPARASCQLLYLENETASTKAKAKK